MKYFDLKINIKAALLMAVVLLITVTSVMASSHREAPLIAYDPLADNTDLYAFRSPDNPFTITIVANYIPAQLPHGGPNYNHFGEDIRYEIHIDNEHDPSTPTTVGEEIIYRFTFSRTNEDPSTFFNIRLGQENLNTTYTLERSMDGGDSFTTIISNGKTPPAYVGERSITGAAGLNTTYSELEAQAIMMASTGEKVFAGPRDDPFFVDLGGIFDLGNAPRLNSYPRDGLAKKNVSSLILQIPISTLQKDGKDVNQSTSILDPEYIIGVWASASRQQIRTLNGDGTQSYNGPWVQVSRIGMPLTNEVIYPIGQKDEYNSRTPYNENQAADSVFTNPELALYMDTAFFAAAVPSWNPLQIQSNSLGTYDFTNYADGLAPLKNNPAALSGTAFDEKLPYHDYLLRFNEPRSVDILPIFHTGVPNLIPYQLATGKGGNPLAAGKPFINNFLPVAGDMLRLNMSTPVTTRDDPNFSSLGLIQAAILGLTDTGWNSNANLEFIPNMDGFPNGRRLEDDVTRIEIQVVSGLVLAATGLWYDDYDGSGSPVTQDLLDVLTFTTGVESNDIAFLEEFPYLQTPWSGKGPGTGDTISYVQPDILGPSVGITGIRDIPVLLKAYPNPFNTSTTFTYKLNAQHTLHLEILDMNGKLVAKFNDKVYQPGVHQISWNADAASQGVYIANLVAENGQVIQSVKMIKQ